ncbi:MAG: TOBE domain-containing protein, partial [Propionibacteriaceae bacterium]|nr:TOBE domain-containing protein [Propionibacteriaceae bacterium]
ADFIGRANFLDVQVLEHTNDSHATVEVLGQRVSVPAHPDAAAASDVVLLVRPESIRLAPVDARTRAELDGHEGRVVTSVFFGDTVEYEVETEHGTITAVVSDPNVPEIHEEGADVEVRFNAERAWLLPRDES